MNMIPSLTMRLHLLDKEFRLCQKYWLCQPMFEENSFCPECQRPPDSYGDHQVGCGGNGDRIFRHNSLRDILFAVTQVCCFGPQEGGLAPALVPGSICTLAGVLFSNWCVGKPAVLDVTVISPIQQLTVSEAANTSIPTKCHASSVRVMPQRVVSSSHT